MTATPLKTDKHSAFVDYLFVHCERDKGFAARLRRADNSATEYQSWEVLAKFNVNLNFSPERLPHALIAAAVAKSRATGNGTISLGHAIALAFDRGANSEQANMRLRRLLACNDVEEACRILRPLITLIQSRVSTPIDFSSLLKDLLRFNRDPHRTKARWAQQFYRSGTKEHEKEGGN
ncbi:type I-E CRISPR-associated protein Cse2/CasB [Vibrio vulnificus]|uniref:type I-E CRISPR-associated protein Cse2/CasB n=1 Tax=Vibrio vulnificus TaxID=672 RepID=UPI00102CF603|nr:type I-E CRISPR-associated protein Cse2/CasB [Vibrio vulnificus]EIA0806496.1 type I-E CRISPR-associated protein Cse2/CasB [Vibrio vulnificus]EJN6713283.1 type I-E CRISPR-associated protein Cse2/CasB [Vibrio vulnificus]MCU8269053.1 type I-E CRISPR-associated protein Cse2/CasB [Vibrio vulnificus]RZR41759.1 type I-E CRISPR-associated protein Cse2/CasB [Vibrio vulnificus]